MRGQTTLDFAVGIVIFIVIIGFVFLFINNAVAPFTDTPQDDTVAANRIADKLTSDLLGASSNPYVLDANCTETFFSTLGSGAPPGCAYTGTTLNDRIDLSDRQNVNVTLVGNTSGPPTDTDEAKRLCWDKNGRTVVERDTTGSPACDSGYTKLYAGDDAATASSSIAARRVVSLAGRDVTLIVEVW